MWVALTGWARSTGNNVVGKPQVTGFFFPVLFFLMMISMGCLCKSNRNVWF